MNISGRARAAAVDLVFAVPPLAALAFILAYGVNAAHWDHLFDTEVFRRFHDRDLTIAFLFSPHNEHRRAFHRLVVLALGSITRWNNVAELVLDWVLVAALAIVLYQVFPKNRARIWFVPVLVMLFSLRQHQALLVADCVSTFLCLTFSVVTLVVLSETTRAWTIPLAAGTAIVATFSHANGLLLWPIGALLLWSERTRLGRVGPWAWAALGTIVSIGYFTGMPAVAAVGTDPVRFARYFVVELGGAFTHMLWPAAAAGATILVMSLAALRVLRSDGGRLPLGGWLMAFGFAATALVAFGRSKFPLTQALESRYAVFSGLVVSGLYLSTLAHDGRGARLLRTLILAMMAVNIVPATVEALRAGRVARNDRLWDAYVLYTARYQSDETLNRLFPNAAEARTHAAALERLRLNVFAEARPRPEALARTNGGALFWIDQINYAPAAPDPVVRVRGNETVTIAGWAADPGAHRAAPALFGVIDGALRIPAFCGLERPDVVRVVGPRGAKSGFVLTFSSDLLTRGIHSLALEVVAADGLRFFPTAPIARIERQ